MKLSKLLKRIENPEIRGNINVDIKNLAFNTKDVSEKTLYFCYKGVNMDGHDFFEQAKKLGACAFVVEKFLDCDLPQIKVNNVRKTLSLISSEFFGNPANNLKIIGLTGTNGKTSTTYIIEKILKKANIKVAVIGTNGIRLNGTVEPCDLTTPDPIFLHKTFLKLLNAGVSHVVMEVSAHSIALDKIAGIDFEVSALTNITQDHLDFFGTMEEYSKTKLNFLNSSRRLVINVDDPYGKKFFAETTNTKLSYSVNEIACIKAKDIHMSIKGNVFVSEIFGKNYKVKTNLVGDFNIHNVLCAVGVCLFLKIDLKTIIKGVKNVYIEGRFNVIPAKKHIVVDYAHTPDGLENILTTARKICKGRIITVFGCGGNRDRKKRALMGEIVSRLSDETIVTSDNPRFENPMDIIKEIKEGIIRTNYILIENRKEAIFYALSDCKKDDFVMICGKGAEEYQDINGTKIPYSDYKVVKEYFNS